MPPIDYIAHYLGKPCKFRLRTDKTVFGVLWCEELAGEENYFFASTLAYKKYLKALEEKDFELSMSLRTEVNVEDFAMASLLPDQTEEAA